MICRASFSVLPVLPSSPGCARFSAALAIVEDKSHMNAAYGAAVLHRINVRSSAVQSTRVAARNMSTYAEWRRCSGIIARCRSRRRKAMVLTKAAGAAASFGWLSQ